MKEYLYKISLRHKSTGENMKLFVWGENVDKATHSLCGVLIGYKCEYEWHGSSPAYKNNELVEREK